MFWKWLEMGEPLPMADVERLRREEREIASWDTECDVLVVGAGCAGMCAAIEAAQAGARQHAPHRCRLARSN